MAKTQSRVQGAAPKESLSKAVTTKPISAVFMLDRADDTTSPPWLLDKTIKTKPTARKSSRTKTPVKAKPTPKAKKPAATKKKVKAATRIAESPIMAGIPLGRDAPPALSAAPADAPLARNQAPVLWQKNGPFTAIRFWLRSTGRGVLASLGAGKQKLPKTNAPIAAKLRTKNDLLREIAVLRQENATMRERLGLPVAAFGRVEVDRI